MDKFLQTPIFHAAPTWFSVMIPTPWSCGHAAALGETGSKSVLPGERGTKAFEALPGLSVIPLQEQLQQEVLGLLGVSGEG